MSETSLHITDGEFFDNHGASPFPPVVKSSWGHIYSFIWLKQQSCTSGKGLSSEDNPSSICPVDLLSCVKLIFLRGEPSSVTSVVLPLFRHPGDPHFFKPLPI